MKERGRADPDSTGDPELMGNLGPGEAEVADVVDDETGVESGTGRRRTALAIGLGLAVLAIDQLSKWWALETLENRSPIELIGSLQLSLHYNTGAAFSVGSEGKIGPLIAVLAVVVVGLLLRSRSATSTRTGAVSVGMIAGGAFGNLADRAFRDGPGVFDGAVIDFIDVQWWPVFNIADSAICIGALTFVVLGLREPSHSR